MDPTPTEHTPHPPDAPPEADPAAQSEAEQDKPSYNHRRTGHVAQLPEDVRDQLNQLIVDGVPLAQIPPRLGDAAKGITAEHLRRWLPGGHQDWLRERDRKQDLRAARESASGLLKEKAGTPLQDAGRTVAATQLYDLLLSFDPRTFAAALVDKPELYLRLINAISRLSEADAACGAQRLRQSLLSAKLAEEKTGSDNQVVTKENLKEILHQITLT